MRYIESDDQFSLRGSALQNAIDDDIKLGLIPFWVSLLYIAIFDENSQFIPALSYTVNVI